MTLRIIFIAIACGFLASPVIAADEQQSTPYLLPRVSLLEVLDAVSKRAGHSFVVDKDVGGDVVVGQVRAGDMDYATLLVVLRNNGLAAVKYEGTISIINVGRVRQYPLPVMYELDDTVDEEEWVTMIIKVQNTSAPQFVPIMRPMLPQEGHMIAHSASNMITIVDRYGNVERVLELIRKMDYQATQK